LGRLKAKLAKLKSEVMGAGTKSGGKAGDGFDVTKSGDTRVGLIGFPSVGKSTLLTTLTGTESLAAGYEFTTLTAIPGTLHYKGARIQIVDLPGIIEGAKDGKGRGRQVIGTARTCELILIVLDASKPVTQKKIMERELEGFGIRLNKKPPNLIFTKKAKGGLTYRNVAQSPNLDEEAVKSICSEYRIHNADITNREPNASIDDLIDVIENSQRAGRVVYIPW
jgi:small GTP-binding protein